VVHPPGTTRPFDGVVLALDVDGVLLDPELGGRGSWLHVLGAPHGIHASQVQAAFFAPYWADIVTGRAPIEPALAAALEELRWPATVEEFLALWFETDFQIDRDVLDAVTAWAAGGARLLLVTNQEHRRAAFLKERLTTMLPIEGMAYSAEVGFMKEDSRFFPIASELLGITRHEHPVVFVDDGMVNVEAAHRYGWDAVHFVKGAGWWVEVEAALTRAAGRVDKSG
jgi:putative hydrolase of the HAD superfamily